MELLSPDLIQAFGKFVVIPICLVIAFYVFLKHI